MSQHQIANILLSHIRDGWTKFAEQVVGSDALDRLSPTEMQRLAQDTGLTQDELAQAITADRHVAELLGAMLAARGLDRGRLMAEQPATMRVLEVTCSRCNMTGRCQHELKVGTAAANAEHFCPNADTMGALAVRLA